MTFKMSHAMSRMHQTTVRITGHPRIVDPQYGTLLHVIFLVPKVWKWLLDFLKNFGPLV